MVRVKPFSLGILLILFSCSHPDRFQDEYTENISFVDCHQNERSDFIKTSDTVWVELSNGMVLPKIDSLYYWDDMVFSENSLYYLCLESDRSAVRDVVDYYWPYSIVPYNIMPILLIQQNSGMR